MNINLIEQSIGNFFDDSFLLKQKRERILVLMKESIDRGVYSDNIKCHLKVLLTLLHLNNVKEDEQDKPKLKVEAYPKTLYDKNMAMLLETWSMFEQVHEETCRDEDEVISLNSIESDSEVDPSDPKHHQTTINQLFSKSAATISLGIKRLKEKEISDSEEITPTEQSEPIFKSQFIKHDFLNNNRNVVNSETVNDIISMMIKTLRSNELDLQKESSVRDCIFRRISNFNPESLLSKVFAFTRLLERLVIFCKVANSNYIAQKLQYITLEALNSLQDDLIKMQHDLIVQIDPSRDRVHNSNLLYKRTPPFTFFSLNRWIMDKRDFFIFLADLSMEFKNFNSVGNIKRRKHKYAGFMRRDV